MAKGVSWLSVLSSQLVSISRWSGMPESEAPLAMMTLLSCCVGLLLVLLLLIIRIIIRLSRVEGLLAHGKIHPEMADAVPAVAETSPGGAFETFLSEDSSRRLLSKSEQFAAYRQWRDEKGLNWSNS